MDKNIKMALIIGGIIVGLLIIIPTIFGLFSGWQGYGYGMMGPGMMGGFGWGGLMGLGMIVFWGLIIWGIVAVARSAAWGNAGSATQNDSALELLKKRYARGEINKEEFDAKKKDLT